MPQLQWIRMSETMLKYKEMSVHEMNVDPGRLIEKHLGLQQRKIDY